MDSNQSKNNSSGSLIKAERLIYQAKNINCTDSISFDILNKKYELLNSALDEIKNCIHCDNYVQLIKSIQEIVSNFGYEIAYNRSFESQSQVLHRNIVLKLFEIAEKALTENELLLFLKEKSMYTWDEPERSLLLKRIYDIGNHI